MAGYKINGPIIAGDVSFLSTISGETTLGGTSNTATLTNNAVNVGGSNVTALLSGSGSVNVGGASKSITVTGDGDVSISASGTIGLAPTDTNLVMVGGSNTTLAGTGSVAAGPSSLTKLYNPANPKMFVMGSPVITKTGSTFSVPGILTPDAVSGGLIEFTTTPGAYTLPSSSAICAELLDVSLTSFTGAPRHSLSVTFYNNTGGISTVAVGAGQIITNTASPVSLGAGESRTWILTFLTPSTILVEDSSPITNVSLTNVGTTSLVNNGTAPNLATKGLASGTGIGLTSNATDVTISNTGVTNIAGTAFEIGVTPSTGSVTVSLPSSVIIPGTIAVPALTQNSYVYSGTSGLLTTTAAPTDG